MEGPSEAGMVDVAASVMVARPVAEVFAFVTDAAKEPLWHTALREATQTSHGPMGVGTTFRVRYDATTGIPDGTRVIRRFERDRLLAADSEAGTMKSTVTYHFEPAAAGARITRRVVLGATGDAQAIASIALGVRERNEQFLANLKRLLDEETRPS